MLLLALPVGWPDPSSRAGRGEAEGETKATVIMMKVYGAALYGTEVNPGI